MLELTKKQFSDNFPNLNQSIFHLLHGRLNDRESVYSNIPKEEISNHGRNKLAFILNCKIATNPCNFDYFTEFYHQTFMRCFTYEASEELTANEEIMMPGPEQGISLILFQVYQ